MLQDKLHVHLDGSEWSVTSPYKLPNNEHWQVTIKKKNSVTDEKYFLIFTSKIRADIFKKGNVNSIRFYEFIISDRGSINKMYMASQKDVDLYISQSSGEIHDPKEVIKKKESIAKEMFGESISEQELFGDDPSTDNLNINEMLEAWEDYFEDKSDDAIVKAKTLLASISNHYMTKDLISRDIYVRNKLLIQAESLSMLFMQLSLTKQLLMKFFKEIMSDVGSKATYDAFSQQQKFVLEINTYMNKTIQDIIQDMQQAKKRDEERQEEEEQIKLKESAEEGGTSLISTRDKKKLLAEIDNMIVNGEIDDAEIDENYVDEIRKKREDELNIQGGDF